MDSSDIESMILYVFKHLFRCVCQSNTLRFNRRVQCAYAGCGDSALNLDPTFC